jgi:hypothetical protein
MVAGSYENCGYRATPWAATPALTGPFDAAGVSLAACAAGAGGCAVARCNSSILNC